jgi:hypothetical protein
MAPRTVIVAATGPSLTSLVSGCAGRDVIAVNDAVWLFPNAVALYAADFDWWQIHGGVLDFGGLKLSARCDVNTAADVAQLKTWGVSPAILESGSCSLHGGISVARMLGYGRAVLVGADMRVTNPRHYFGDHPAGLRHTADYSEMIEELETRASRWSGLEILNATPGSALTAFPFVRLEDL